MPTEVSIKDSYKELHDLLSESYYNFHNITKEEFGLQHGKIWTDMEAELIAGGHLTVPPVPRNLEEEIDALKVEVKNLKEAK
tara:strand:+ start:1991 stop:2236 length:246 start_codon:yes stop_codon:yes gene_type:complete